MSQGFEIVMVHDERLSYHVVCVHVFYMIGQPAEHTDTDTHTPPHAHTGSDIQWRILRRPIDPVDARCNTTSMRLSRIGLDAKVASTTRPAAPDLRHSFSNSAVASAPAPHVRHERYRLCRPHQPLHHRRANPRRRSRASSVPDASRSVGCHHSLALASRRRHRRWCRIRRLSARGGGAQGRHQRGEGSRRVCSQGPQHHPGEGRRHGALLFCACGHVGRGLRVHPQPSSTRDAYLCFSMASVRLLSGTSMCSL